MRRDHGDLFFSFTIFAFQSDMRGYLIIFFAGIPLWFIGTYLASRKEEKLKALEKEIVKLKEKLNEDQDQKYSD